MEYEQSVIHKRFCEMLPELNVQTAYGAATRLVREKLDRNFGKPTEEIKAVYEVEVDCGVMVTKSHTFTVEAWSEEEACDKAIELANEQDDYTDVEVSYIKKKESKNDK